MDTNGFKVGWGISYPCRPRQSGPWESREPQPTVDGRGRDDLRWRHGCHPVDRIILHGLVLQRHTSQRRFSFCAVTVINLIHFIIWMFQYSPACISGSRSKGLIISLNEFVLKTDAVKKQIRPALPRFFKQPKWENSFDIDLWMWKSEVLNKLKSFWDTLILQFFYLKLK